MPRVHRTLDLDQVAAVLQARRSAWLAEGIEVAPLTWRDSEEPWPKALWTDRQRVRDPDSVGLSVKVDAVEGRFVVFRGGWADVELAEIGGLSEPLVQAPEVAELMSPEA